MPTILIPKTEYDMLRKRASLYETMLRRLPERKWGIERYSERRIREFMREDRVSKQVRSRLRKLLT